MGPIDMSKNFRSATFALIALSVTGSASAQSLNPLLDAHEGESRISAAITLPLGKSADSRRTAPRFEIVSQRRMPGGLLPVVARDEHRRWQERRIGFTLDGSNQLMINGRPTQSFDQRRNLNTLETIGVVAGIFLVVSTIVVIEGFDDFGE